MMEEELRLLLHEQGWNMFPRMRGTQVYLYAQKWREGEVYITPRARVDTLTKEQVLDKLARPRPKTKK